MRMIFFAKVENFTIERVSLGGARRKQKNFPVQVENKKILAAALFHKKCTQEPTLRPAAKRAMTWPSPYTNNSERSMSPVRFPKPVSGRIDPKASSESSGESKNRRPARESDDHRSARSEDRRGSKPEERRGSRPQRSEGAPDERRAPRAGRPASGAGRPSRSDDDRRGGRSDRPSRGQDDRREARRERPARGQDDRRDERRDRPERGADRPVRSEHSDRPDRDDDRRYSRPERSRSFDKRPAKSDRPKGREGAFEAGGESDDEFIPLVSGAPSVLELLETAPERVDAVFLRKGRHTKDMDRIADLCREHGVRFSLLEADAFARTCPTARGAAARIFQAGYVALDHLLENIMDAPLPLVVVLDQVQDPGNAGTLARTLYAMGAAGMVVPRHNGVYLGAAAFKAAAGALALLPVAKCANISQALEQAEKLGITVYGAAVESRTDTPPEDIFTFTPRLPAVLVLGGEESGMRPGVEKHCDALLRIPMLRPFNSLNVAQAGAIITACFAQARKAKAE